MKNCKVRLSLISAVLLAAFAIFATSGCGAAAGVGAVTSNLVGGFAVKGPIKNGTVNAYVLLPSGEKGILLAEGSTNEKGAFQLVIEDYEGPVWLEVVSGTFKDEGTGIETAVTPDKPLTGVIPDYVAGEPIANISITPLTSIAASLAKARIAAGADPEAAAQGANEQIADYFGLDDIITSPPPDLTEETEGEVSENELNSAAVIAGLANVAASRGVDTMDLVNALMDDVSDGDFDGQNADGDAVLVGGVSTDADLVTSELADGIENFMDSELNQSGAQTDDVSGVVNIVSTNTGTLITPVISSVIPWHGLAGEEIEIIGENFQDGAQVYFGGVEAVVSSIISDNYTKSYATGATIWTIFCTVPNLGNGEFWTSIKVVNPNGKSAQLDDYFFYGEYVEDIFEDIYVYTIDPPSGLIEGGITVTIYGDNFPTDTVVTFGTTDATDIVVAGDGTWLTCTLPAAMSGVVTVTVADAGFNTSDTILFEYLEPTPIPQVLSCDPPWSPYVGGMTVNILGYNFTDTTELYLMTQGGDVEIVITDIGLDMPAGKSGIAMDTWRAVGTTPDLSASLTTSEVFQIKAVNNDEIDESDVLIWYAEWEQMGGPNGLNVESVVLVPQTTECYVATYEEIYYTTDVTGTSAGWTNIIDPAIDASFKEIMEVQAIAWGGDVLYVALERWLLDSVSGEYYLDAVFEEYDPGAETWTQIGAGLDIDVPLAKPSYAVEFLFQENWIEFLTYDADSGLLFAGPEDGGLWYYDGTDWGIAIDDSSSGHVSGVLHTGGGDFIVGFQQWDMFAENGYLGLYTVTYTQGATPEFDNWLPLKADPTLLGWNDYSHEDTQQRPGISNYGMATLFSPTTQVVYYGGDTGDANPSNETWLYQHDIGDYVFNAHTTTAPTTARVSPAMGTLPSAYSPYMEDTVIMHGGNAVVTGSAMPLSDFWAFTNGSGWSALSASSGTPSGRWGATLNHFADVNAQSTGFAGMVLIGGNTGSGSPTNQIWHLTNSGSWYWNNISVSSSIPPLSFHGAAWYNDPTAGPATPTMIIFGGDDGGGPTNDTYAYYFNQSYQEWWVDALVVTGGPPPARENFAMAYVPGIGIVVHGGMGSGGPLNDTWILSYDAGAWKWTEGGQNSMGWLGPRYGHRMVSHPDNDEALVIGGNDGGEYYNALFMLNLNPFKGGCHGLDMAGDYGYAMVDGQLWRHDVFGPGGWGFWEPLIDHGQQESPNMIGNFDVASYTGYAHCIAGSWGGGVWTNQSIESDAVSTQLWWDDQSYDLNSDTNTINTSFPEVAANIYMSGYQQLLQLGVAQNEGVWTRVQDGSSGTWSNWQKVLEGPNSRINDIALHPDTATYGGDYLFALAAGSGLWRCENAMTTGNPTWQKINGVSSTGRIKDGFNDLVGLAGDSPSTYVSSRHSLIHFADVSTGTAQPAWIVLDMQSNSTQMPQLWSPYFMPPPQMEPPLDKSYMGGGIDDGPGEQGLLLSVHDGVSQDYAWIAYIADVDYNPVPQFYRFNEPAAGWDLEWDVTVNNATSDDFYIGFFGDGAVEGYFNDDFVYDILACPTNPDILNIGTNDGLWQLDVGEGSLLYRLPGTTSAASGNSDVSVPSLEGFECFAMAIDPDFGTSGAMFFACCDPSEVAPIAEGRDLLGFYDFSDNTYTIFDPIDTHFAPGGMQMQGGWYLPHELWIRTLDVPAPGMLATLMATGDIIVNLDTINDTIPAFRIPPLSYFVWFDSMFLVDGEPPWVGNTLLIPDEEDDDDWTDYGSFEIYADGSSGVLYFYVGTTDHGVWRLRLPSMPQSPMSK